MKLTKHRCKCGACGRVFSRASVFDKHRAGPYGDRRCMQSTEMIANGLQMVAGIWKGLRKVVPGELQTTSAETNTEVAGRAQRAYYDRPQCGVQP